MTHDPTALYNAYVARDPRFDGVFFVGVTSTGIYCRPVCTARTPRVSNCRFFTTAAAAEQASFRPCLRCRPELAPDRAPVDGVSRAAILALQRITDGAADDRLGVRRLASELHMSPRHLRRVVRAAFDVTPMELLTTRRLLLAKQLLVETSLPVTDVAFASGFRSLRRFNDAFLASYGMPPTRFRRPPERGVDSGASGEPTLSLRLDYRPPFDWLGLLDFLRARALAGVEEVTGDRYRRTIRKGDRVGWIEVRRKEGADALELELPRSLTPVLPAVLAGARHLFDLAAQPSAIADHLSMDDWLRPRVLARPGLRVPGAFDGFELALRAVLGQQVTVGFARKLADRFVAAFGEPLDIAADAGALTHLTPTPARVAALDPEEIGRLGIIRSRAAAIVALARAVDEGVVRLEPGTDPDETTARLLALPGIGPWTASYIVMRALHWPDTFPASDAGVRSALGGIAPSLALERSKPWRPWRAYATLHLWNPPPPV